MWTVSFCASYSQATNLKDVSPEYYSSQHVAEHLTGVAGAGQTPAQHHVPHKFHQNSSFVLQVRSKSRPAIKAAFVCERPRWLIHNRPTERLQVALHAGTLSSGRPHTQTKRRHRSAGGGDAAASSHSRPAPAAPHCSSSHWFRFTACLIHRQATPSFLLCASSFLVPAPFYRPCSTRTDSARRPWALKKKKQKKNREEAVEKRWAPWKPCCSQGENETLSQQLHLRHLWPSVAFSRCQNVTLSKAQNHPEFHSVDQRPWQDWWECMRKIESDKISLRKGKQFSL